MFFWYHQINQKINEIFVRISALAWKKGSNQKSSARESKWNHPITVKVEIFLEQREVAFLSASKICENLNFSTFESLHFRCMTKFWLFSTKNADFCFEANN